MEKCPFCSAKLKKDNYNGPMGLEEDHGICKNCKNYSYSYEYGHTETMLNHIKIFGSYNQSFETTLFNSILYEKIVRYYLRKNGKITYPIVIRR